MANLESSQTWIPLKRELDKFGWDYQRIEDKTTPGIPDVNIHIPASGDCWVEMKCMTTPAVWTNRVNLGLSNEQFLWLRRGLLSGRRVILLARVGEFWYTWKDEESFKMARDGSEWGDLRKRATMYDSPRLILTSLSSQSPQ